MSELRWEAWAIIIALIITMAYTIYPGPYCMGAFTFIAQPLFGVAVLNYILRVYRDLRKRHVI